MLPTAMSSDPRPGREPRHHHLGGAGAEPDDDGPDDDRGEAQERRDAGRTDDELVGGVGQQREAGDGPEHREQHRANASPRMPRRGRDDGHHPASH
jgi:hypothetical protein